MKTIAIFFGGDSNEHEISIITGMMTVNLLRSTSYRILPVYLPRGGGMRFAERANGVEDFLCGVDRFPSVSLLGGALVKTEKPKRIVATVDCALNCCHGGTGEDGTLSALLAWNQIPSASPNGAISSAFMDKSIGKAVARGLGIAVLDSLTVREEEWQDRSRVMGRVREFGYPVIVKPCKLGSSIGISVVRDEEELTAALDLAFALDDCALLEEYRADRRDLNCAAYLKQGAIVLSSVEEVFSNADILTFGEKYESGGRRSEIPARITQTEQAQIETALTELYRAFGANGVVRADFLLSGGVVYFNELNTVPGSLAYYLFCENLTSARSFLLDLLHEARVPSTKPPIVTGILSRTQFGGSKGCKMKQKKV